VHLKRAFDYSNFTIGILACTRFSAVRISHAKAAAG